MAKQLANTQLFGRIVLNHEEAFAARSSVFLDACDRGIKTLGGDRLGNKGEGTPRQPMGLVFIEGQHLYRNVACSRVLFQVIENGPAQHVGEKYIQGHGGGVKFAGQRESFRAPGSEQDLEALLPGEIAQNSSVMRVVFDD